MKKIRGRGKKENWNNLRSYAAICVAGVRKTKIIKKTSANISGVPDKVRIGNVQNTRHKPYRYSQSERLKLY
jgi:hypothetical protein